MHESTPEHQQLLHQLRRLQPLSHQDLDFLPKLQHRLLGLAAGPGAQGVEVMGGKERRGPQGTSYG